MLLTRHTQELRESGLNDETIDVSGIYSVIDPIEASQIVNWQGVSKRLVPAIVFPFRHADGTLNGFARLKPDKPVPTGDGPAKYLQPRRGGLHAYFTRRAVDAIRVAGSIFVLLEGEKKGLAVHQAGYAAIALTGVQAWRTGKEPNGEPKLISDLGGIDWAGHTIVICFDTDEKRKPGVNIARAQLARAMDRRGAKVILLDLPLGPRCEDGRPEKMGADDFIVRYGEQAFRDLVESALQDTPPNRSLDDYRQDMAVDRVASVAVPGVYQDTSPPGSGKSHADAEAMQVASSSLVVLPTHSNCKELEITLDSQGIDATAYPQLSKKTCENYAEAEEAMGYGLSVSSAVCLTCLSMNGCEYHLVMTLASEATHSICTHRRAELSFESVAKGRKYISIHEDAISVLQGESEFSSGLATIATIADAARMKVMGREDKTLAHFFHKMAEAACWLQEQLRGAETTSSLPVPSPAGKPIGVDVRLLNAIREVKLSPYPESLQICRGLASGEIDRLHVRVDTIFTKGKETAIRRSIVATTVNTLPDDAAIWFNDATADPEEIEEIIDRPIINLTPKGRLATLHDVLQVPLDITKGTSPKTFVAVLRGVLAAFPGYHQIGVICDRKHVPLIQGTAKKGVVLDEASRDRIAKIEHFRSGMGRGSNSWLDVCDFIIVFGTPRVPPLAIKNRLLLPGNTGAAARDGEWGWDAWSGVTQSGKRIVVKCRGYADHDWHSAHRRIVAAELLQGVGRGRAVCENGIPVVVVTTEELGVRLVDFEVKPVVDLDHKIMLALAELSEHFPKGLEKGS